jgi:ArsR family transcriptional regulator
MDLVSIYECLCDRTRLRILHLLAQQPLCVCHFQDLLGEPQVKISKHLAYLRKRGMVESSREGNWMVYRLPAKPSPELARNLACLQDCAAENKTFKQDLTRLRKSAKAIAECGPVGKAGAACCSAKKGCS